MDNISYSTEAENILHLFYGKDKLVYVEGDNDIPFWEYLFGELSSHTVEVKPVGGKLAMAKHIKAICEGKAGYFLAMDSDYDCFTGENNSPFIIKSFGYSIENSLISPKSICKVLKDINSLPARDVPASLCETWVERLNERVKKLVIYSILNQENRIGKVVFPDGSAQRFLSSKTSFFFSEEKIDSYIKSLGMNVSKKELEKKEEEVIKKYPSFSDIIQGHFLFSAALSFINNFSKKNGVKGTLSNKNLFIHLMNIFESHFGESHNHFSFYKKEFERINQL